MSFGPRRIFVVHNDAGTRQALVLTLRSYGWCTQAFHSLADCLYAILKKDPPDCVVCGLDLPMVNGAQFIAALSAKGVALPVVVVANRPSDSSLVEQARACGAAAVLRKPFLDSDLERSIRHAVHGKVEVQWNRRVGEA